MADKTTFLADIRSDNADVRFRAWRSAGEQDASVLPDLAKIAGDTPPGVRKAALEAMTTLTHSVGKAGSGEKRSAVANELMRVGTGSAYAAPIRAEALRLLSLVGGDDAVMPVAKLLSDAELREEAIFCLERIPGDASVKAIAAAYGNAPADFKGRILAALGHRRATLGVPLSAGAMRGSDKELAISGARAFGRIGAKPAGAVSWPSTQGLSEWQRIELDDSRLRYADGQVAQGNHAEAMRVYKDALERPEEHLQCAAIVGIAKINTAEAAAAIFPKLKSNDRKVRLAAEQAWKRMAATESPKG